VGVENSISRDFLILFPADSRSARASFDLFFPRFPCGGDFVLSRCEAENGIDSI